MNGGLREMRAQLNQEVKNMRIEALDFVKSNNGDVELGELVAHLRRSHSNNALIQESLGSMVSRKQLVLTIDNHVVLPSR